MLDWIWGNTTEVVAYAGLALGLVSTVLSVRTRRDQVRERRKQEDAVRPFGELRYRALDSDGPWFAFMISIHNPGRTPFRIESFEVEKPKGAVLCFPERRQFGEARTVPSDAPPSQSMTTLWEIGLPKTEQSTFASATTLSVKVPENGGSPGYGKAAEIRFCIVLKGRYKAATARPVQIRAEFPKKP